MKDYSLELKDLEKDLVESLKYVNNFNISKKKKDQLQLSQYLVNRLRKEVLNENISLYLEKLEEEVNMNEESLLDEVKKDIKNRFKDNLQEYRELDLEVATKNGHVFHLIKELLLDIDQINNIVGYYPQVMKLELALDEYLNHDGDYPFTLLEECSLDEAKDEQTYLKEVKELLSKTIYHLKDYRKRKELWFGE